MFGTTRYSIRSQTVTIVKMSLFDIFTMIPHKYFVVSDL